MRKNLNSNIYMSESQSNYENNLFYKSSRFRKSSILRIFDERSSPEMSSWKTLSLVAKQFHVIISTMTNVINRWLSLILQPSPPFSCKHICLRYFPFFTQFCKNFDTVIFLPVLFYFIFSIIID